LQTEKSSKDFQSKLSNHTAVIETKRFSAKFIT
jgi:hypothetical protein